MIVELTEYYWNLGRDFSIESAINNDIFLTHIFITNKVINLSGSDILKIGNTIHNIEFISSATNGNCLKFIVKLNNIKHTLLYLKI